MPQQPIVAPQSSPYVYDGVLYSPGPAFPVRTGIVTVNAGVGITSDPLRTSRAIPSGCRILIKALAVTILNGPAGQLLVSVGSFNALPEWFQINTSLFSSAGQIPINQVVDPPGPLFIDLSNITGTTFIGAQGAAVNLNVTAILDCLLLYETNRARVHG